MKTLKKMNHHKKNRSWMQKIIGLLLLALIPIILLVTVLFLNTNRTLQDKAIENMLYGAKEVRAKVDDTILNVYGVSDTFASEQRLLEYLDRTYESKMLKRQSTVLIMRRIFDGYNLLKQNEQIASIYTYKDEVFNFVDPNNDQEDIKAKLMELNIDDPQRLGKFYWYPLMDNFLTMITYNEVRKDKVIVGTRRVFSPLKSQYAYIHIFALQEEDLYEKYMNLHEQLGAQIYIVNERAELLSSSDEVALEQPEAVLNRQKDWIQKIEQEEGDDGYIKIHMDKVPYYLAFSSSQVNGWKSIVLLPEKAVLAENQQLYIQVIWILVLIALIYIGIMLYMYRGFMNPINQLIFSMEKVYEGDLDQELEEKGREEVKRMLRHYNSMLKSIKTNIKERLESEQQKKQLEYEVLMSQVNPHFLYNTLESIVWMATEAKRPDIRRLAASLGRLYRLSVGDGQEVVSINKEIEHVTAYCHIQKNRYQEKVNFQIEADPELTNKYYVIKMILQPVVENIFIHAVDHSESPVSINLRLKEDHKYLRFFIADNGVGIDRQVLLKIEAELRESGEQNKARDRRSTGIGLGSVYKRLRLHYGDMANVKIYSRKGKGTVVVLQIPKIDYK